MKLNISVSSNDLSVPLPGSDDYDIADALWKSLPHHLWDSSLRSEIIGILSNSIRRGKETIQYDFDKLRDSRLSIRLTLRFVDDLSKVHLRGDYRYPSTKIANFLMDNPSKNTPPIQLGKDRSGFHVLDGHHRWRGYIEAGRKPLALEIALVPNKVEGKPTIDLVVKDIK